MEISRTKAIRLETYIKTLAFRFLAEQLEPWDLSEVILWVDQEPVLVAGRPEDQGITGVLFKTTFKMDSGQYAASLVVLI